MLAAVGVVAGNVPCYGYYSGCYGARYEAPGEREDRPVVINAAGAMRPISLATALGSRNLS